MPSSVRRGVRLLAAAVLLAVAYLWVQLPDDDLARRVGCSSVTVQRINVGADVLVVVHADGCRIPQGRAPTSVEVAQRLASTVWRSLELPVDAIRVEQSGVVPGTTVLTATELAQRFGPGPSGIVRPASDRRDDRIWLLLPIGHLVAGLTMVLAVRRMRRAGVVVLLFRRH